MDVDRGDERAAAGEVVRAPGAGRVDARDAPLSVLAVTLLKGVLQREDDERLWASLQLLQSRLRDFVAVLGLELVFDEAEGHAFLRSRPDDEADDDAPDAGGTRRAPRLVARRPLSYPVSLVLAEQGMMQAQSGLTELLAGLPFSVQSLPGGHHMHLDDEAGAQSVADCSNPFFLAP